MTISQQAVADWIAAFARAVAADRDHLTALDAAIGDADHGVNMDRGLRAVAEKLAAEPAPDIGALLSRVGTALVSSVGGASGPLYGTLFLQMGAAARGQRELDLAAWTGALERGVEAVARLGKSRPGEKTMLDALAPAVQALRSAAGATVAVAMGAAERAAHAGMLSTIPLVARKGRASYLGERSAGHQDPGATSAWLMLRAAAEAWKAS
ncbi:MAG TPA: dihydroxyacetone kinase subunit DhaL [Anaeromyxobacteraceae bacterium]|nr:dihydroxyacetone kinase subunit DhaL [Anaeromyxobacteraceae bacterium]